MKFVKLTETEFRTFSSDHPQAQFAQSVEFSKLQRALGREAEILGVKKGDKILTAGIVIWHLKIRMSFGQFYLGPLIGSKDQFIINFFAAELKEYTKNKGAIYCTMSPYLSYQTVSQTGEPLRTPVKASFNNFRRAGFKQGYDVVPKFIFKKDLKDFKSDKELLHSFTQNTRTAIRNAGRDHITVRTLKYSELDILKALMEATAQKQGFKDKTFEYYQELYKQFAESKEYTAKFLIAELDMAKLKTAYQNQKETLQSQICSAESGQKKELTNQLEAIK